ncbi:hypothetical protein NM688_g8108 [Phlebia brevispora]|uniref:Uncharacterized protein n=1 Tax=Phlebia brevispora TaxID=194682 RepID=A0ACC1RXC2_9APHY|nr:hypothetical protein NM688_g8108 [Phlebia brevispora]
MDGFDDLLAPTRDALESNPFADTFGKRPASPDPWTTFQDPASGLAQHHEGFGHPGVSGTHSLESPDFGGVAPSGFHGYNEHEDILGATSEATTTEPEPYEQEQAEPNEALSPRSPGFRESISTTVEEVIAPIPQRQTSPSISTLPPESTHTPSVRSPTLPSPIVSPVDTPILGQDVSAPHSPFSFQRQSTAERPFYSPLEQPSSAMERSFASLSLGGETVNGWQGSQSMFVGTLKRPTEDDDDDDDDKPILQTLTARGLSPSIPSSPQPDSATSRDKNAPVIFTITVDDPQRIGDPIRGYTLYTVHTKTNSPLYTKSAFSVLRRYSDFLWLYETLSLNNPGVVVPPVPEKSPFNRFDASFVQQRRLALEKCIQKIANHPVLQRDADLKLFLEHDNFALEIKHRKAEIAHEKGGLMTSIGQSIVGPRFYETDEWFDKQKGYLDSLELQLRGLVKSVDLVSKQRTELAAAAGEFAQAVAELATSEDGLGPQLSSALAGLATVERTCQELQDKQAEADTFTIMATADEYARLINSVRLAFSSRIRMYHAWQSADSNVKRVKQQHESTRALGKIAPEQLNRSLALVADAERRALDAKQDFESCSRLVKTEVARFEQERIEDFKNSLEVLLNGMIAKQKELIATWENFQTTLLKKAPHSRERLAGHTAATDNHEPLEALH